VQLVGIQKEFVALLVEEEKTTGVPEHVPGVEE